MEILLDYIMKHLHKKETKILTVCRIKKCTWYLHCRKPLQSLYMIEESYKSCSRNPAGPYYKASSVSFLFLPKASSCDQELQSALEEAKQPQKDNVFIPECAQGGLYKPVQCHPSTGYCWCVLVDTGRPIPGTSTR